MFVVDVLALLVVPVQLATFEPTAGLAVTLIEAPELYCPVAQPAELVGEATGSLPEPVWLRVSV